MSNRTVYEVAPRGSEWTLSKRGVERPLHVFDTKAKAVAKGIELGRAHMPSQLLIKLANGKIEEDELRRLSSGALRSAGAAPAPLRDAQGQHSGRQERTYGDDPFPPAG